MTTSFISKRLKTLQSISYAVHTCTIFPKELSEIIAEYVSPCEIRFVPFGANSPLTISPDGKLIKSGSVLTWHACIGKNTFDSCSTEWKIDLIGSHCFTVGIQKSGCLSHPDFPNETMLDQDLLALNIHSSSIVLISVDLVRNSFTYSVNGGTCVEYNMLHRPDLRLSDCVPYLSFYYPDSAATVIS